MSRIVNSVIVLATVLFLNTAAHNQTSAQSLSFDVIDYNLRLEPDIDRKSINGKQRVKLVARTSELKEVEFNCGELTIDAVTEKGSPQKFVRRESKLLISLARPIKTNELRELEIDYHGTPRRGIRFFPDRQQVYTVFSTSQWMVCVDAPEDK